MANYHSDSPDTLEAINAGRQEYPQEARFNKFKAHITDVLKSRPALGKGELQDVHEQELQIDEMAAFDAFIGMAEQSLGVLKEFEVAEDYQPIIDGINKLVDEQITALLAQFKNSKIRFQPQGESEGSLSRCNFYRWMENILGVVIKFNLEYCAETLEQKPLTSTDINQIRGVVEEIQDIAILRLS